MTLPIPVNIWTRIVAFLVPGSYGQIILYVENGQVTRCQMQETVKADVGSESHVVSLRETA